MLLRSPASWILLYVAGVVLGGPAKDVATTLTLQDLGKDMDRLVDDERLFNEYYQCLLDLGPCNKNTTNFKDMVQEALERGCERCSPSQRKDAVDVLRTVMECRPREFAEIERHFDPKGHFREKYQVQRGRQEEFEDEENCGRRWD